MKQKNEVGDHFTRRLTSLLLEVRKRQRVSGGGSGWSTVGDVWSSQRYLDRVKNGEVLCKSKR